MSEPFIPPSARRLQDKDAIALLPQLRRYSITVPDLIAGEVSTTVPTAAIIPQEDAPGESPLLLLHGFDSSLLEFRHLIPHLTSHWPLYAFDLLGFGFTAHLPSVEITTATIGQHLYATWKALINRPVTLLGASLGGAVAIDFALTHPECVERLVLVDSVGFSGNFPLGKWLFPPLIDWGTDWLHFRKDTAFRAIESLPFISADQQDLVLCSSLHQEMPGWKQAVKSFTRSGGYYGLASRINQIQQQTLIIWGEWDTTLNRRDAEKFSQAIPHSQLVRIQRADHVPHIRYPAAVATAMTEHLFG